MSRSSPAPDQRIGTRLLGRYRIDSVIGHGGMGVVYAGVHEKLGRPVAVKFLHAELGQRADAVRRFFEEARAAAALEHANVVAVYDLDIDESGAPFMVLERLEGESLQARVARGPLSPAELRAILIPVLDALHRAHQAGIVHRDLKPDNIFLHRSNRASGDIGEIATVPKVLDFGIAKLLDAGTGEQTTTGVIVGTPRYMAPEQTSGERIGAWTDVWAMGVVAYRALSGSYPIDLPSGLSAPAVLARILVDDPVSLAEKVTGIDPALAAVIDGCLVKDTASRTPSARAFAMALGAAISPDDVAAAFDPASTETLPAVESPFPSRSRATDGETAAAALAETQMGTPTPTPRDDPFAARPESAATERTEVDREDEDPVAPPAASFGRLVLGALVAAVMALFFVGGEPTPQADLRVIAPRRVEANTRLPVRVELSELGDVPRMLDRPVRVGLSRPGHEGTPISADTPSAAGAVSLEIDGDSNGRWILGAWTQGDPEAAVLTEVEVGLGEAYAPRPRLLMDQQHFEIGPLVEPATVARDASGELLEPEAPARLGDPGMPTQLEVRVEGGACNPEHGCAVLVWVGGSPAAIAISGVTVEDSAECAAQREDGSFVPTRPSEHILRCELRPSGNDADILVIAHRDGHALMQRRVSLPVVLGAPRLDVDWAVMPAGATLQAHFHRLDPATPILIDGFQDGHWRSARTLPAGTAEDPPVVDLSVPGIFIQPGLWRVQVRSSPFDSQNVATRMVLVHRMDETGRQALTERVSRGAAGSLLDPLAGEDIAKLLCDEDPTCSLERYAAFWLAGAELDLIDLPAAVSGAEQEAQVLAARAEEQRYLVAGLVLLLGLGVSVFAFRSGMQANAQAERVLESAHDAAGDEDEPGLPGGAHRRGVAQVAGQALLVFVAFALAASVVLARGCM